MKKIIYPEKKDWMEILRRPALNTDTLRNTVKEVLDKVKMEGDKAVREYEERFDKVKLDSLEVTETEIAEAEKEVPIELKAAIMLAQKNIHTFHSSQRFEGKKVQHAPGVAEAGAHADHHGGNQAQPAAVGEGPDGCGRIGGHPVSSFTASCGA